MTVLKIKETDCQDCYKCVRFCPVKAIKIKDGHASIIGERCLGDGGCVEICPQKAKEVRQDWPVVKDWLEKGEEIIVSLAPSYLVAYRNKSPQNLVNTLYSLGFKKVEETAIWADYVARAHQELLTMDEKNKNILRKKVFLELRNLL